MSKFSPFKNCLSKLKFGTYTISNTLNLTNILRPIRRCGGPSVLDRCALSICCTFFNLFILIKAWFVFTLFIIINTIETFASTFAYIYIQKWKNTKVQRNIELWRYSSHLALFKTLRFMVLFCFTSSDQSDLMLDWL